MTNKNTIDFSTILASSVHDMKNSVGVLLSSVESILEVQKPKTVEEAKHFSNLHYEASRINGELVQLLTLYRKDNNFLPVHIDEVFVCDVLEDQVARNQVLIDTSGIRVDIQCDENLVWYFDADLIGGVLHNIIINCLRYTKDRVLVSAHEDDGMLVLSVSDNGNGYPEDMLVAPSGRVEEAMVSEGATHLGLYFAEQIATLHKQKELSGYIKLANDGVLNGGEFKLYLP